MYWSYVFLALTHRNGKVVMLIASLTPWLWSLSNQLPWILSVIKFPGLPVQFSGFQENIHLNATPSDDQSPPSFRAMNETSIPDFLRLWRPTLEMNTCGQLPGNWQIWLLKRIKMSQMSFTMAVDWPKADNYSIVNGQPLRYCPEVVCYNKDTSYLKRYIYISIG